MEPIFIHSAARTKNYGYVPADGRAKAEFELPLVSLLATPANEALGYTPVRVDGLFVSCQFPSLAGEGAIELLASQVQQRITVRHSNGERRISPSLPVRIDSATNGLTACVAAIDFLRSGRGRTALVIGGEKLTPAEFASIRNDERNEEFVRWAKDVVSAVAGALSDEDRRYCLSMPVAAALLVAGYCRTRRLAIADVSKLFKKLSILAFEACAHNPLAFQQWSRYLRKDWSRSEFEKLFDRLSTGKTNVFADPIHRAYTGSFCDGASALLLSSESRLPLADGKTSESDVAITGSAIASDFVELLSRDSRDRFVATRQAAARAYDAASMDIGIFSPRSKNPSKLLVEHHDAFIPLALLNLEDLHLFADHLEVINFLTAYQPGQGNLLLNPSGGLLEGHPFGGTGITKVVECFARLTKRANAVTPAAGQYLRGHGANTAIVHSFGGMATHVGVVVLDRVGSDGEPARALVGGADSSRVNLGTRLVPVKRSPVRQGRHIVEASVSHSFKLFDGLADYRKLDGCVSVCIASDTSGPNYAVFSPMETVPEWNTAVDGLQQVDLTPTTSLTTASVVSPPMKYPWRIHVEKVKAEGLNMSAGLTYIQTPTALGADGDPELRAAGLVRFEEQGRQSARARLDGLVAAHSGICLLPEFALPHDYEPDLPEAGLAAAVLLGGYEHKIQWLGEEDVVHGAFRATNEAGLWWRQQSGAMKATAAWKSRATLKNEPAVVEGGLRSEAIGRSTVPTFTVFEISGEQDRMVRVLPILCVDIAILTESTEYLLQCVVDQDIDIVCVVANSTSVEKFSSQCRKPWVKWRKRRFPCSLVMCNASERGGSFHLSYGSDTSAAALQAGEHVGEWKDMWAAVEAARKARRDERDQMGP